MATIKVHIVSLGCAKNLVDTELMMGRLTREGMVFVPTASDADVILVNTCGFLQDAKEESVDTILELAASEPKVLAVTGCMVERYREEIRREIPEIDVLLGVNEEAGIADRIYEALKRNNGFIRPRKRRRGAGAKLTGSCGRVLATPPHTAYLRIAEGCDLSCSFCVIPEIRGPQRSRPQEEIVEEARWLADQGVREISVIAQDITRYGSDLCGEARLPDLVRALAGIPGIRWVRLHYANPLGVTEELAHAIAEQSAVCKYLDMPVQHANDRILRAMRRGETQETLFAKVALLRERVPGIVLRTTVMVGFPGETDGEFRELLDFLGETEFDHVGVFTFSAEEGTPAAEMPDQVDEAVKNSRLLTILHHLDKLNRRTMTRLLDTDTEAILDRPSTEFVGFFQGRTPGQGIDVDGVTYVRGKGLREGEIVPVRIIDFKDQDLFAERRES